MDLHFGIFPQNQFLVRYLLSSSSEEPSQKVGAMVLTRVNAFTTGNPFFTILLEVSIGRDFGALKGLRVRGPQ